MAVCDRLTGPTPSLRGLLVRGPSASCRCKTFKRLDVEAGLLRLLGKLESFAYQGQTCLLPGVSAGMPLKAAQTLPTVCIIIRGQPA